MMMMLNAKPSRFLAALLLLVASTSSTAFQVAPGRRTPAAGPRHHRSPPSSSSVTATTTTATALHVFGNKKPSPSASSQDALLERARKAGVAGGFWEGEWVCKDCGYIYNRAECAGLYFEEQGPGFRCPQCSGPRRRYAKKVGDRVGTTLDGGDAPILLFSFGGVIITILFGFWAANNL